MRAAIAEHSRMDLRLAAWALTANATYDPAVGITFITGARQDSPSWPWLGAPRARYVDAPGQGTGLRLVVSWQAADGTMLQSIQLRSDPSGTPILTVPAGTRRFSIYTTGTNAGTILRDGGYIQGLS